MALVLTILFVLICPLLIVVVLIQDPKGGGLAGVLGGAGGTSAFGARTAEFITWVTTGLGFAFFALALALTFMLSSKEAVLEPLADQTVPAQAPAVPASTAAPSAPVPAPQSAPSDASAPASAPAAPSQPASATPQPGSGN